MNHSRGWQVEESPGRGDKKAGGEATAVGMPRNLSGVSAVRDHRACRAGDPHGQLTAPPARASSSRPASQRQPKAGARCPARAPGATVGCKMRHPRPAAGTSLVPLLRLDHLQPWLLRCLWRRNYMPAPSWHCSAQLSHTSPQISASAAALGGLQHDSEHAPST